MSNPTSNFGWQMPTPTDLVTSLPADFEVFGQAVDSSLADLKGGTTGQVLSKNSNTDMDFVWVTDAAGDITGVTAGTGISGGGTSGTVTVTNSMATAIDAKGDLIAGTGADTFSRLAVSATNGQVLSADSSAATGLAWAIPSGMTLLSTTALTGASVTVSSISTSYNDLKLVFEGVYSATDGAFLQLQCNGDTGNNYAWQNYSTSDGQATGSGTTNASYMQVSKIRNSSAIGTDGFVLLSNYTKTTTTTAGISSFSYSNEHSIGGSVMFQSATAITSVKVQMSSGNISGGTLKIYGVK